MTERYWDDYREHELIELAAEEGADTGPRMRRYWFGATDPFGGKLWVPLPISQLHFDAITSELSLPVWLALQKGLV